jgi:hypothetical protein
MIWSQHAAAATINKGADDSNKRVHRKQEIAAGKGHKEDSTAKASLSDFNKN